MFGGKQDGESGLLRLEDGVPSLREVLEAKRIKIGPAPRNCPRSLRGLFRPRW